MHEKDAKGTEMLRPLTLAALVSILVLVSCKLGALAQQAQSAAFKIQEWTYVQATPGVIGITPQGSTIPHASVAPAQGGQSKSPSYMVSLNFLTDEFNLLLLPPNNFHFSTMPILPSASLAWTHSPDTATGFVTGYRLTTYDSPSAPIALQAIDLPIGTSESVVLSPGVKIYATLEAYFGDAAAGAATYSVATSRVMCVWSQNRSDGDANGDGSTDGRDFIDALFAFELQGQTGHNPAADIDASGTVSSSDLTLIDQLMGWQQ